MALETIKIAELPSATQVVEDDYLVIEQPDKTKKATASQVISDLDLANKSSLTGPGGAAIIGTEDGQGVQKNLDTDRANTRELWRRALHDLGLTLVDGSFEEGATLTYTTDAIWHMAGAQCYTWSGTFPKSVSAGLTPSTTGSGWITVGGLSLLDEVTEIKNEAVEAKDQAEDARDEARAYVLQASELGNLYASVSEGLAATTDGQYFQVPQGSGSSVAFKVYKNNAGIAQEAAQVPGTAAVTGTIREFPTLAAAQADADAGNIQVGSTAYYRSPDDITLAIEVINNGGTLEATGRRMPSQEFIDLIASQVTAEITARSSLVDVIPPTWSKYLAVIQDAAGYEAWGIDKEDGSPTDHTIAVWMRKMEQTKSLPVLRNIPGYGLAFTMPDLDGEERLTDLSLRSSDGQFHDWVLQRWATRMAPVLQPLLNVATRPTPAGTWKHPSGDYVPYVTDLRTIVGLGSSSTSRSNSTYTAMAGDFDAAYVSMGTSGAIISQNAAHIGAVPALITVSGGSIPASGGVAVTASNIPSNGINMAMGGTLAGVPGAIAWSSGNTGTFTRSASGTAVTVPDGTPFIPNSSKYRANQIILESGKNDINQNRDAAYILTMTETIVDWLAPFLSTAVVMGHFNNHAYTTAQKTTLAAVNAGIVSTYGNRAIDQQAWLVSSTIWDQLAAEGVTPTTQDLADQAAGLPPTQLMVAEKDHLTPAAYGYRMKYLVKPKLIELGLYKETN